MSEPVADIEKIRTWSDENPYCLMIRPSDNTEMLLIDLGEQGWSTTYADWMRTPGRWFLLRKGQPQPVLALSVVEGEQPYYTARHIGVAGSGGGNEITAYGLGKKRKDGHVDRLWVLPNGTICGGDDAEPLAMDILYSIGPRTR